MENLVVVFADLTAILLFIFCLEYFSTEIAQISDENFRPHVINGSAVSAMVVPDIVREFPL